MAENHRKQVNGMSKFYEDYPDLYDCLYSQELHEDFVNFVLQNIDLETDESLLSVGCGTGEKVKMLENSGMDVTGLEPAQKSFEKAKEKTSADLRKDSIPNSDLESRFDVVVALFSVLNHIDTDRIENSIRELYSLTSEGGTLIFDIRSFPEDPGWTLELFGSGLEKNIKAEKITRKESSFVRKTAVVGPRGIFLDKVEFTALEESNIRSILDEMECDYSVHREHRTEFIFFVVKK
ncbi:MAG: class I SAM-dependent methyltransferase [Candidatus Nanohaloarchaea archaeon]